MSIISWLTAFIEFLNSNNGIITALATVILVIITWRYVCLTGSLLKATYKPQIFISLRYEVFISPTGAGALCWQHICVKNIGVGPARKVVFGGDLSFKTKKSTSLKEMGFIKNGIDAVAHGQEMSERVPLESHSTEKYPPVLITVTYKDSMGDAHNNEFTLDFNNRS